MLDMSSVILLISCFLLVAALFVIIKSSNKKEIPQKIDTTHVNENSFQNYAKFYGEIVPSDADFNQKLNSIYTLVKNQKMTDINKIALLSSCSPTECVLKIRYLKNKRLLDDLYIDTVNMKLMHCSLEDQKLLDKYKPYIYGTHTQIDEFVNLMPNPECLSINDLKNKALEELIYLDKKS